MGYYTRHSLDVLDGKSQKTSKNKHEIIAEFRGLNEEAEFAIDENGEHADDCKWYRHKEDMLKFSKLHKDTIFVLSGVGEEHSDYWQLYVMNGESHLIKGEVVFKEFNLSDLKKEV